MKLTNTHRNAIIEKVLIAGRMARTPALERQEDSLALRATKRRFGDDVFERCRALPEGWLNTHKIISIAYKAAQDLPNAYEEVSVYRGRTKLQPVWFSRTLSLSNAAVLPNIFAGDWNQDAFGSILWSDVYDYFAAGVALHEEMKQLRIEIRGVLAGFTTVERLAEGWPEGYSHLPAELLAATGAANLPAVRIEDLNARLAAFGHAEAA